jgi:hypothetical protein
LPGIHAAPPVTELEFHRDLAWGVIATGAVVFVALFFIVAPYGRHTRGGWGLRISNRLGWMVMESPAALGFAAIFFAGRHALEPVPLIFCGLWLAHYLHRAFIYPLRMAKKQGHMPVSVMTMAIAFNAINAYLNARYRRLRGRRWRPDPPLERRRLEPDHPHRQPSAQRAHPLQRHRRLDGGRAGHGAVWALSRPAP